MVRVSKPLAAFGMLALTATIGACTTDARPARGASTARSFRDCKVGCPEMVVVPPGDFDMGANAGEADRPEGPVHHVTIGYAFALGAREVSNAEYAQYLKEAGRTATTGCRSFDKATGKVEPDPKADYAHPGPGAGNGAPDMPAICVSWTDAKGYVAWLSRKTGKHYRLPSESEWEYAARAGAKTDYFWGADINAGCGYANLYDASGEKAGMMAVFGGQGGGAAVPSATCDDGHAGAAPVGSFKPNAFGLYDMIGNVWEWTQDCYRAPYAADVPTDGKPYEVAGTCDRRAVRSGSWMSTPFRNRVSWRGRDPEDQLTWIFGFRVARDL